MAHWSVARKCLALPTRLRAEFDDHWTDLDPEPRIRRMNESHSNSALLGQRGDPGFREKNISHTSARRWRSLGSVRKVTSSVDIVAESGSWITRHTGTGGRRCRREYWLRRRQRQKIRNGPQEYLRRVLPRPSIHFRSRRPSLTRWPSILG